MFIIWHVYTLRSHRIGVTWPHRIRLTHRHLLFASGLYPPLFFLLFSFSPHITCGLALECCCRLQFLFDILTSTSSYWYIRSFSLLALSSSPKHPFSSCILSIQPLEKNLLPEVNINDYGKKCVVIDLDETLVHSSFKVRSGFPVPPCPVTGLPVPWRGCLPRSLMKLNPRLVV